MPEEGVEDLIRSGCTCWQSMVDYQLLLMLDNFILGNQNHTHTVPASELTGYILPNTLALQLNYINQ